MVYLTSKFLELAEASAEKNKLKESETEIGNLATNIQQIINTESKKAKESQTPETLRVANLLGHSINNMLGVIDACAIELSGDRSEDPAKPISDIHKKITELAQLIDEMELAGSDGGNLLFENLVLRDEHKPLKPLTPPSETKE